MKKILIIIAGAILAIAIIIALFFIIRYQVASTDITITLNDQIAQTDINDTLTYNTDISICWDNTYYKVVCNNQEIEPGQTLTENGDYTLLFKFKKVIKEIKIHLDKNLTFTITDYDGNTIYNYNTNKKPFLIITEDTIRINNNPFQPKVGIYQCGDYKITSSHFSPCIIKLNPIESGHEYNFYFTISTLPTLYAGIDMVTTDKPSYIWYANSNLLNREALNKNPNFTLSHYIGDQTRLTEEVMEEAKTKIKEIMKNDENAYFHLYVDDVRHWIEYPLLAELGLDEHRYDVTYFSDHTKSYDTNELGYTFCEEDGYKNLLDVQERQMLLLADIRSNLYANTDHSYFLGYSRGRLEYDNNYIITSTLRNNISYLLEYPELVKFQDEKVMTAFQNEHVIQKILKDLYESLTEEQKQTFYEYAQFDKAAFESNYLNGQDEKEYLIILGTDPIYGNLEKNDFMNLMEQVSTTYGRDYHLLFKPHPSAVPNDEDSTWIGQLGITILPTRLPMEVITLIYPNIKIGGFSQSLYMITPKENVLFFFAEDETKLTSPLNLLYHDLFEDTIFLVPEKNKEKQDQKENMNTEVPSTEKSE